MREFAALLSPPAPTPRQPPRCSRHLHVFGQINQTEGRVWARTEKQEEAHNIIQTSGGEKEEEGERGGGRTEGGAEAAARSLDWGRT